MKVVTGILIGLAAIALIVGLNFFDLGMKSFFAPKYAALNTQVQRESQAYNEGMVRDLENLQMQYQQANDDQKTALKAIILHRFSVYPEDRMPASLRNFYNQLKGF